MSNRDFGGLQRRLGKTYDRLFRVKVALQDADLLYSSKSTSGTMDPVTSKVSLPSLLHSLDLAKAQQDLGAVGTISGGSGTGFGSPDAGGQNAFVGAVENHIDEYQHGQGYLHKGIDGTIDQKNSDTSALLASIDPKSSALYSAYSTQLSYDKRARFVENLSYTIQQIQKIRSS